MFGKYGSYTDRLAAENRELKQKIATYESETAIAEMKASCDKRIRGAEEREKRSHDGWMKALEANKELKERNAALWREKESYRCRNNTLQIKNERLERFEGNRLERIRCSRGGCFRMSFILNCFRITRYRKRCGMSFCGNAY